METIVSLDAHKTSCTYIIKQGQDVTDGPTRIPSTHNALTALAEEHPDATFLIEASGVHEWMHDHLTNHDCQVFIGHPIKREGHERKKSDEEDPTRFAAKYQVSDLKQVYVPPASHRKTRDWVRQRVFLKQEKTRLTNRIKSTLTRWGYFADDDHADPLTDEARTTILEEHPYLEPLYALVDEVTEHLKQLDKKLERQVQLTPEARLLSTIPGVGPITAMALHTEIADVSRFDNAERVVSYFGLDPVVSQSGDRQWHEHRISKKGRAYVRGLLTQAAWSHVRWAPESSLSKTYHRLKERIGTQRAIVALGRRLAKVAYHVLTDERAFTMDAPEA